MSPWKEAAASQQGNSTPPPHPSLGGEGRAHGRRGGRREARLRTPRPRSVGSTIFSVAV